MYLFVLDFASVLPWIRENVILVLLGRAYFIEFLLNVIGPIYDFKRDSLHLVGKLK